MFFSGIIGLSKPDDSYFHHIQRQLYDVDPGQLLLIDDAEANVLAARSLGWNAILYKSPSDLDELTSAAKPSP